MADLNAEWIPIWPNTDMALMLALAWEIQHHGAQDQTFLERYCVGWPQLAAYLRGAGDGLAKTPQWANAIIGIPVARIRRLARQLMAAPRSMLTCAYALQRAHRGEQLYWMVITLAAMLGQIGLPGGGFAFGHGSMNSVGNPRLDALAPSLPLGVNPAARPDHTGRAHCQYAAASWRCRARGSSFDDLRNIVAVDLPFVATFVGITD